MIVTAKQGRGNKVHLSLDGVYRLTVDGVFWAGQALRSGDDVSQEAWESFCRDASARAAHERALRLLGGRAHSRKELEDKLARNADRETAAETVREMERLGLLDDGAYARALADELARRRKWAASRIRMELLSRGISREETEAAVDALELDEAAQLRTLLEEQYARRLSEAKERARVTAALQRIGYSYGEIRRALDEWDQEHEISEE